MGGKHSIMHASEYAVTEYNYDDVDTIRLNSTGTRLRMASLCKLSQCLPKTGEIQAGPSISLAILHNLEPASACSTLINASKTYAFYASKLTANA